MASTFDRWEKDPFFCAAEEVQESADRMESSYRTWIHAMKDTNGVWNLDELQRDLRTTLGTTKWQLEEFERAARSSYTSSSSADNAKDRHQDFIIAIENQITIVESSLNESTVSNGKPPLPLVRLDEGERNELAVFLSGPSSSSSNRTSGNIHGKNQGMEKSQEAYRQTMAECSRSSSHLVELVKVEAKDEKFSGHRRAASASADIGSWNIMVADDLSSRELPSPSGLLTTIESSMSQLKWLRNGYKKLKLAEQPQEADTALPRSQNRTKGMNICYEKSKSCLEGCDHCYETQLYGWYGTIQRQLQRSQYHMQYTRLVQVIFSAILILCLLVLNSF